MPSPAKLLASASGITPDPNFRNVTLLLHGDGSNGAQNNTFLDSSSNNFTVTRNGNTTQGSFNPYGSRWSNYFDGSGDYLTAPDNAPLQLGSSDFTIEFWVNFSSVPGASQGATLVSKFDTSNTGYEVILFNNTLYFQAQSANIGLTYAWTPTAGRWYHVAWSRSGANSYGFIDGALVASTTAASGSISNLNQALQLGRRGDNTFYLNGYLSDVRVVKGTAVYTAAFTPPTVPLTAITNTSLLTCQSNRFRDASTNNFAITRNGDVRVTPFSPYAPTAPYSATANGGSMYFDGTGDYLSYSEAAGDLGTGDWTLEAWVYCTATPANYASLMNKNWTFSLANGDFQWSVKHDDGFMSFAYVDSGITNVTTSLAPVVGAWRHYAVTRVGTTLRIYADGVLNTTATLPSGLSFGTGSSVPVFTGYNSRDNTYFTGYISGLRAVAGTALYTGSTYTVPTAPPTAITNTQLLLNGTNAAIFDSTADNDLETVGNAQISTSVKKFGTGSMAFDGTGDYLRGPSSEIYAFGTGDFTVEMWAYFTDTGATNRPLFDTGFNSSTGRLLIRQGNDAGSANVVNAFVSGTIVGSPTFSFNQWVHVAVVRQSGVVKIYINGVGGTGVTASADLTQTGCLIGAFYDALSLNFTGYIDDLRVTKGVARYTANFTPPAAPFPDQ